VVAQFGDNFPGGHNVVFDGQDAGHKAGLICSSIRSNAHFAKKNPRLNKLTFIWPGFAGPGGGVDCLTPAGNKSSKHK
jgi:hypothetical protein